MTTDVIRLWNWIDILVIIVIFRICYVAIKSGFPVELFKFLGTIIGLYVSLHYYARVAGFIRAHAGFMPDGLSQIFSFLVLVSAGYLLVMGIRKFVFRLIKMEAVSTLNKWLGLFLGLARGCLVCGLVIFALVISGMGYLNKSAHGSFSARSALKLAANTYGGIWHNFMSKFMTAEEFNKAIPEIESAFSGEKQ